MERYNDTSVVLETNAALPGATITVFDTGTLTPSAIFENAPGTTAKANPFTSSTVSGQFSFCAANGVYDVQVAKTGATTYTLSQVTLTAHVP